MNYTLLNFARKTQQNQEPQAGKKSNETVQETPPKKTKTRKLHQEGRSFLKEWELKYFFLFMLLRIS